MKIALIRREYITHLDGVNRFIALLAEGLTRLGHNVTIFSWCYRGIERRELQKWFKEIHCLDILIPIRVLVKCPCRGDPWARMAIDWYFKGSRILHDEDFDAAIVNGVIPLRFKPKIAVCHGITLKPSQPYLAVARCLYKRYDKVICVSHKLRDEVRTILGVGCEVIPLPMKLGNGIPGIPKEPGEREDVIVHIGTSSVKNPQISIKAVKLLRRRGYGIRLLVIGSSATLPTIEGIEYVYKASRRKVIEILCKAKALILPSSYEALPYAVLEAMACGTPVVVSKAVPEEVVISGFNGIRVNNFDSKTYANALENLLRNEELWIKLSRNGLEFVKQFNYMEIAKKYVDVIHQLL